MTFAALALMAAMAASFTGWGLGARRLFRMEAGNWPVTLALGVAATIFLGGLLNDAGLAFPPALAVIALAGLGLAIAGLRKVPLVGTARDAIATDGWMLLVSLGLPLALTGAAAALLLPPSAYNFGDDFEKYFAYPVRMLETGTLAGGTLNSMGAEALGGQSFLDGFVVAALPIATLNLVDTIFGFGLCLLLAAGSVARRKDLAAIGVACVLAVALINPQIVNISSLYLGAALMAAAVALTADPRERPHPAALGLLYAALVAMKPTFALFAGLHGTFTAVALYGSDRRFRAAAIWLARTAGFAALFLAPWVVLHAGSYIAALTGAVTQEAITATPHPDVWNPLSPMRTAYGASMLEYTIVVIATAVFSLWSARSSRGYATAAAGLTLIAAYGLLLVVAGPMLAGADMSLRYFTPFAIGLVPMIAGYAVLNAPQNGFALLRRWLPLGLALVPVTVFAPSFAARCEEAWTMHHELAFSTFARDPVYLDYNRSVLSGDTQARVTALQSLVPAGEPIVAWTNQPFLLDYDRNPITDVNVAGLSTPWADLPKADYIIWEYLGYASTRFEPDYAHIADVGVHEWLISARALAFAKRLRTLSANADALYNDGHVAVFKLRRTPLSQSP